MTAATDTIASRGIGHEGWLVSVLKLLAPGFLDKSLDAWLRDLKLKAEQTGT